MKILSLGAGVQSSTILMMSILGELERLDAAIFADTQWESKATYRHLWWLAGQAGAAGIPLYVVTRGDVRTGYYRRKSDEAYRPMPYFTRNSDGSKGMTSRQCTQNHRIIPIEQQVRRILGVKRITGIGTVETWLGISMDEMRRVRQAKRKWQVFRYPLIEDVEMTRGDCIRWNERRGFPIPPRSACLGCPFQSDREWTRRLDDPEEWAEIVAHDREIRENVKESLDGVLYLHHSRKPVTEIEEWEDQPGLWGDECAGVCGV